MKSTELCIVPFTNLNSKDDYLRKILSGFRSSLLSKFAVNPKLKVYSENFDPYRDIIFKGFIVTGAFAMVKNKITVTLAILKRKKTVKVIVIEENNASFPNLEGKILTTISTYVIGQRATGFLTQKNQRLSQKSYEKLLLAQYYFKKYTPSDNDTAIALYQKVLQENPNHSFALSGMAATEFQQFRYGVHNISIALKLRDWLKRALEINPENVQAHTIQALVAMYMDKDFYAAGLSFQNALQLKRDFVDTLREYVWYLLAIGQDEKAFEAINKALTYDPVSLDLICTRADIHRYRSEYAMALKLYERAYQLDKTYSRAVEGVTAANTYLNNEKEAKRYLEIYSRRSDNQFFIHRLACELAQHFDDRKSWEQSLEKLMTYKQNHDEVDIASDLMSVYVKYEPEMALTNLQKAFENGIGLVSVLRYPVIEPLRKTDIYRRIVGQLDVAVNPEELEKSQSTLLHIKSELNESLTISKGFFVFAKAEGNYTTIHYLKDAKLTTKLLRMKINALTFQLSDPAFMRVHNSYLVNLEHPGLELIGNAHKAKLVFERYDIELPISRSVYPLLK
ncbi:hypothetical protein MTsPCn5_18340 [Croceitalea sp. MTPC5]|uniref:LytTR family transcriptional regulator DNA-binding domain-containing protein n=1 Tax=Croceitalea sp. MTPC5 TaxID=3056565 RepID=UPI002B3BD520|nr:hypothetical protein MTsPCn5_18340 [Croceitalea sp. MTPC5]